jgi:hypothetical protein
MTFRRVLLIVAVASLAPGGCAKRPAAPEPAATPPATDRDPRLADPDFWWNAPAMEQVEGPFEPLWSASERAARDLLFVPDRRDFRGGVLTTEPMISSQWFEPWRRELSTASQVAASSVATERRTVRFDFVRRDGEQFAVEPRVLIERQSVSERPLSNAALARTAFGRRSTRGTRESDREVYLPDRYWYAIGRDVALERRLADAIRRSLQSTAAAR